MTTCNISIFPNCEDYSELILSITFFVVFIVVFYFSYGLFMEKIVLNKELSHIIQSFKSNITFLNPSMKMQIKSLIQNAKLPDDAQIDSDINNNNKKILITAICIAIVIFFVGTGLSFFLTTKWAASLFGGHCGNMSYWSNILKNIVVIIAIALTEFLFATYIIANYISVDQNDIMYLFFKNLQDYSNQNLEIIKQQPQSVQPQLKL